MTSDTMTLATQHQCAGEPGDAVTRIDDLSRCRVGTGLIDRLLTGWSSFSRLREYGGPR